ncbi:toxin-antitoxin system YwqK family antitoxin [Pedobacter insulae]|uniref:Antitoxin component YwqK of the YwqJK toxin-antitoxin module n=1 Tax=Pedobacter insulae TaxID=414048 RepID=A0A1I2UUF0_9SPHI|nr:hypothetical protein [Pedobacter insulae]SFG78566.1 hypothetical protein SAMN04489864_102256 [Pedobacter insulae]
MKRLFFFVLFGFNLCAFAQLKPIYFLGDNVISDSTKATSYGIYGKLSGEEFFILKTYDLADNLIYTGSFKDADLKIPHGNFVYYNSIEGFNLVHDTFFFIEGKERFIAGKGSYVDGYQNGRWINFYPDGKIFSVITYVMGIRHGFTGTYSKRGKLMTSGTYKLDKKDGEWLNGKVKDTYIDGVIQLPLGRKSKNKLN